MSKKRLDVTASFWEKVGYLDLVKCVTSIERDGESIQWGKLRSGEKAHLIENCSPYLKVQLNQYKPRLVIAYGKDPYDWLIHNDFDCKIVYAPQRNFRRDERFLQARREITAAISRLFGDQVQSEGTDNVNLSSNISPNVSA